LVTPTLHLWSQPKNQEFRTTKIELGGKIEINISTIFGKIWRPYLAISAKTKGWTAGDVYLNSNIRGRFGFYAFIR